MLGSSSWMPYAPQVVKGFDDDHIIACSLGISLTTYESVAFFLNYPVLHFKGRVTLLP